MKLMNLPPMANDAQTGILESILSDEGIEFFVLNENLSSAYGFLPDFEKRLQVREEDYKRAIEIIKKGFPEVKVD